MTIFIYTSVSDPFDFWADPDPTQNPKMDPDPDPTQFSPILLTLSKILASFLSK